MELELEQTAQLEGHTGKVWSIAWCPVKNSQGKSLLASCSGDKTVRIWEGVPGKPLWKCQTVLDAHKGSVRHCDWSPDGKLLATASFDGTCLVWEKSENDYVCVATLEGHESEVKSVAWNPSGTLLATCGRDKSVWIWEMQPDYDGYEFECASVLNKHSQDVKMVLFHPTRDVLVSCSYDDTIKVWALEPDGDDWICVQTLSEHISTVWQVSFNASGDQLVSCSDDLQVMVWDTSTDPLAASWKHLYTISGYHEGTIYSTHWSSQNGLIATGCEDDAIRIFAPAEGTSWSSSAPSFALVAKVDKAHLPDVNCVRWHPEDYGVLGSAGDDKVVRLWSVAAARE